MQQPFANVNILSCNKVIKERKNEIVLRKTLYIKYCNSNALGSLIYVRKKPKTHLSPLFYTRASFTSSLEGGKIISVSSVLFFLTKTFLAYSAFQGRAVVIDNHNVLPGHVLFYINNSKADIFVNN